MAEGHVETGRHGKAAETSEIPQWWAISNQGSTGSQVGRRVHKELKWWIQQVDTCPADLFNPTMSRGRVVDSKHLGAGTGWGSWPRLHQWHVWHHCVFWGKACSRVAGQLRVTQALSQERTHLQLNALHWSHQQNSTDLTFYKFHPK